MTVQHISDPEYVPFGADDLCEVHIETSGTRGGVDVRVEWGVIDIDDGLEFMTLTYNFPSWEQAGWWLHWHTRR